LLLIVLSFVYLRSPSGQFDGSGDGVVVQVGDTRVTASEYLQYYNRNKIALQRTAAGKNRDAEWRRSELEKRTLRDVLATAALDEFVRRQNYSLSDENLVKQLHENRIFQDSTGKFDPVRFDRAAKVARMSEEEFVRLHNASTIRSQVTAGLVTRGTLPDAFEDALRDYSSEERKLSFLRLSANLFGPIPLPSEGQAKAFYEADLKRYTTAEQRRIVLLEIDLDDIANSLQISESEIAAAYQDRIAVYRPVERRRVQQIAFSSQNSAESALQKLRTGARFETLASGNDVVRAILNPEPLRQDQLSAPIGQVAFSEELLSGRRVINGPFGPTIISVTEVEPGSVTELTGVRREIRLELARLKAADALPNIRDTVEDARASGIPLEQIARKVGLRVRVVEAVDAEGKGPDDNAIRDLPESADILARSFSVGDEAQLGPLELKSGGAIWFDVKVVAPSRIQGYEEVTRQVKQDWVDAQRIERVQSKTDEIISRLERGARIEDIARELKVEPTETDFLKRNSRSKAIPAKAIKAGFQGSKNAAIVLEGDDATETLLITVSEQRWVDLNSVGSTRAALLRADRTASRELLNQMIANLLASFSVSYDQDDLALLIDRNGN
jgi:peptidyl-prolyl cis-trans isomerase D